MRLFIAVTPPSEIRETLVRTYSEIARARWVKRDQLHVTLRFLGEIEADVTQLVRDALRKISAPAFSLRIAGVGTFGHPARVLWCGLDPKEEIAQLSTVIERSLVDLGLPEADHSFTPHLTIARFKQSPPAMVRRYVQQNEALTTPKFSITEFTLYESILKQDGAVHSPLETYPLAERS